MEQPKDPDCIFCRIIAGELPAAFVHRDDQVVAFLDAFPSAPGHTLVLPHGHYRDLHAMPSELLAPLWRRVQQVAAAIRTTVAPDGMVISQFNGAAAGQTVFHYHVHIAPRWSGQDRTVHGREKGDPAELQAMAERIHGAMAAHERPG